MRDYLHGVNNERGADRCTAGEEAQGRREMSWRGRTGPRPAAYGRQERFRVKRVGVRVK